MRDALSPSLATIVGTLAAVVGAPLLGLLGSVVSHARGKGPLVGGGAVMLCAWIGTSLASAMSKWLFPDPPDLLAAAFSLGGLGLGAAVLAWLTTDPVVEPPGRRAKELVAAGMVAGLLVSVWILWRAYRSTTWPARLALPDGAEVLEEHALSDDFLGDHTYRMRARMDEASYRAWMRELHVEPTDDPRLHGAGPDDFDRGCWAEGSYDGEVATFESGCM
jgi:hypothetical protein